MDILYGNIYFLVRNFTLLYVKYDDFYIPVLMVFSFVCSRISCNSSGDN